MQAENLRTDRLAKGARSAEQAQMPSRRDLPADNPLMDLGDDDIEFVGHGSLTTELLDEPGDGLDVVHVVNDPPQMYRRFGHSRAV